MKINSLSAKKIAGATGVLLGAFVATVAAATYIAPTFTPPSCPDSVLGCNPPLNVGSSHQNKLGSLSVNTATAGADKFGLDVFGISRFFGSVEIGTTTGGQLASLTIVDGNQGAGKVLTSDANGKASWQTNGGVTPGGSGTEGTSCNTVVTGIDEQPYKEISMVKDGKNICEDNVGCTFHIWAYNSTYPQGYDMFAITGFRQTSDGKWIDGSNNSRGTNGSAEQQDIIDSWNGLKFSDDRVFVETSQNALMISDSSSSSGFIVSICDL